MIYYHFIYKDFRRKLQINNNYFTKPNITKIFRRKYVLLSIFVNICNDFAKQLIFTYTFGKYFIFVNN